jgi:hypothetical protein
MSRYSVAPRGATGQVILTRQGISLRPVTSAISEACTWTRIDGFDPGGPVISAGLCMSPCSSDYLFSGRTQSLAFSL